jgi:hypothetical protein
MNKPCVLQKTAWLNSDAHLNNIKLRCKCCCFKVKHVARQRLKTHVGKCSQSYYHVSLCVYNKTLPVRGNTTCNGFDSRQVTIISHSNSCTSTAPYRQFVKSVHRSDKYIFHRYTISTSSTELFTKY